MADGPDVDRGRPALVRAGVRFGRAEKGERVCVVEQVERGGPCALRVRFELFGEVRWSAGRVRACERVRRERGSGGRTRTRDGMGWDGMGWDSQCSQRPRRTWRLSSVGLSPSAGRGCAASMAIVRRGERVLVSLRGGT